MIAARFSGEESPLASYDRPGADEVAALSRQTTATLELLDCPGDMVAESLATQLDAYCGPIPHDRQTLKLFVIAQFRSAAGPTAVSALIGHYVEAEETQIRSDAIRRMLTVIRSQPKPALTCDALAVALGIHIGEGRSLQEIARPHGITKQALSKRAIKICEALSLPASQLQRDDGARESYRRKQLLRHAAAKAAGNKQGSFARLKAQLRAVRNHVSGAQLRQPA